MKPCKAHDKFTKKLSKYEEPMKNMLWNDNVSPENYTENDYLKRCASDRDHLLNLSIFMSDRRWKVTTANTAIHAGAFSLLFFALQHQNSLMGINNYALLTVIIFCSLHCLVWFGKIIEIINYSNGIFAAIKEYENLLPSRPLHSVIFISNMCSNLLLRNMRFYEKYIPIFFLAIYISLFVIIYFM